MIALHPFFQVVDHGGETLLAGLMIKFFRSRICNVGQVAGGLNHRHLHAKADAEVGHFALTRELCRFDFAFRAALAKTAGNQNSVIPFEMWRGVFVIKDFGINPFDINLYPIGHAAMGECLFD